MYTRHFQMERVSLLPFSRFAQNLYGIHNRERRRLSPSASCVPNHEDYGSSGIRGWLQEGALPCPWLSGRHDIPGINRLAALPAVLESIPDAVDGRRYNPPIRLRSEERRVG